MRPTRYLLAALAAAAIVLAPLPTVPTADRSGGELLAAATSPYTRDGLGPDDDRSGADRPQPPYRPDGDSLCRPGTPLNATPTTRYYDNNALFGPEDLPLARPVGPLLAGYQRFGGLNEKEFLDQYGNAARDAYVYPPANGFALAPDGRPLKNAMELQPGYRLDRFGYPGGAFLSPLGTPFSSRALPPSNLNTPKDAPLANYHVYCVLKPFTVDAGPIAPWFAQPGWGTQFKLEQKYVPEAGGALSITWLLAHHFLVEEDIRRAAPCQPATGVPASAFC
jgi:hypothetical protein